MTVRITVPTAGALKRMIMKGDCKLEDVLSFKTLKDEFKWQNTQLNQYLTDHIIEITEYALGIRDENFPNAQSICFQLLISKNLSFRKNLLQSNDFFVTLHNSLDSDKMDVKNATLFSKILLNFLQNATSSFLTQLRNFPQIITKSVKLVKFYPIQNLLFSLFESTDLKIIDILSSINITMVLTNSFCDNNDINIVLLKYLIKILFNINNDSPLLVTFTDKTVISKIYSFAMQTDNFILSSCAFKTLFDIASHVEPNQNINISFIITFFTEKLNEICDFVEKPGPFLENKYRAVEIISSLPSTINSVPERIYSTCLFLFNEVFSHPSHTFIHIAFLIVLESIKSNDKEGLYAFITKNNIHIRIAESFENRSPNANYYGIFLSATEYIDSPQLQNEKWRKYVNTTYKQYSASIKVTDNYSPREDDPTYLYFGNDESDDDLNEEDSDEDLPESLPMSSTPHETPQSEDPSNNDEYYSNDSEDDLGNSYIPSTINHEDFNKQFIEALNAINTDSS